MEPRAERSKSRSQTRASILMMAILIATSYAAFAIPIVSADGARDASILLSVSPSMQTVNPGESAEYSVTVRNTGSDPVTINLQSNEDQTQECNSYTSTITQIAGPIDAGEIGEATMNVTLAQGATDECVTTVRATAQDGGTPPGQPDQQESSVTTKSGDGESGPLYGVDLKTDEPSIEYDGTELIIWDVEVENTGRVNETVLLTIDDTSGPGCSSSDLEIEVDPSTVNVDNESSEWVEVRTSVPTGSTAAKHCWTLHGQVQNDPTQNASDDLDLDLEIPEIHLCDVDYFPTTTLFIDPFETFDLEVTFYNEGNSEFTIYAEVSGMKSDDWMSFDGGSSGILSYQGSRSFEVEVTPDDLVDEGSEHTFTIEGYDGVSGPKICEKQFSVRVGQSHGASLAFSTSNINEIEPGGNGSLTATVMNLGNGQDTLELITSAPPVGWGISLSSSSVSVGSRHGSNSQATVEIIVNAPFDALADDAISITVSVGNGVEIFDSDDFTVTVKPVHNWDVKDTTILNQTGRSGTMVQFPITIANDGNIGDEFMFAVMMNTRSSWSAHFMDGDSPITSINVPAFSEKTVNLAVSIDPDGSGEERDSATLTIRVTNSDDHNNDDEDGDNIPDNQRELTFKATLSNRNHSMAISIDESWSYGYGEPGSVQVILAPGGSVSVPVWIENTGDFTDDAFFTLSGLEGIGTRTLEYQNVDMATMGYELSVYKAYSAWNRSAEDYEAHSDEFLSFQEVKNRRCDEACAENGVEQWISQNSDNQTHENRVYRVKAILVITVSAGAENGDGGSATISVSSTKNTVQKSSVNIPILVQSIKKISIDNHGINELDLNYPESATFSSSIVNEGNTPTEVRIFTSEGLRGWVVSLEAELSDSDNIVNGISLPANTCSVDEGIELICFIQPGTNLTIFAIVKSPHGTAIADDFRFTFSAEPTDLEVVGRVNQEFEVHGMPQEGGLAFLGTTEGLAGVSVVLIILVGYIVIEPMRRRRVAEVASRPKYVAELEPLPVAPTGAKRFKANSVEMSMNIVGNEAQVTIGSATSKDGGFAIRSTKGKGKKDIWAFSDSTRMKPQLHCIHRSKKKRIFDVMDSSSNMPFCVAKNISSKQWNLLKVDGTPWLHIYRSGLGSTKTWTFSAVEDDDSYGQIIVSKDDDGTTKLSAERYTTDLDGRALWVAALTILLG